MARQRFLSGQRHDGAFDYEDLIAAIEDASPVRP
jgi:hypothetical protein